eukprot:CAMPEP_0174250136 /NCGR_PEP_ID=MMETSP0439-20130205/402_1 /TAXON_ID=0 /ORGANISM="Stereomyxa ramosa, Strain Chinc5" /LENGTH=137 /DNA_ID=CAMNT_0015330127 /DNA_START=28 /DNA_END=441 /DNA_ORIENTATION=+
MSGFKVVKLCTLDQDWVSWDESGRLYGIAEVEVPEEAKVVIPASMKGSFYEGKRRANVLKIVALTHLDGSEVTGLFGRSDHSWKTIYKTGSLVAMGDEEGSVEFDEKEKTCTPGIHFFDNRDAAVALAEHWRDIHQN